MKLLKNFSLYTFSNFFGVGVGFFIMPILTHYLTPSDYGILSLFNTYVALLIPIISLNVTGYFLVEYYKNVNNTSYLNNIFGNTFIVPSFLFFVFFLMSLFFSRFMGQLIEIPQKIIFLIPILSLLTIYYEKLLHLLVITKKAVFYTVVNVTRVILETSLTVLFVIVLSFQWEGRISSWLITLCIISVIGFIYFKKQGLLSFKINKKIIKNSILYGAPLIFHDLSKLIINQSDRIFISKMVSLNEMGIYNTGYVMGSILVIAVSAFGNIYNPFLYERLEQITLKKKIEIIRMAYIYFAFLLVFLLLITLGAPLFFKYAIDARYSSGVKYVFWTSLSYLFWGMYIVFAGFLFFLKKTDIFAWLSLVNICLNIILNYFLINEFGAIGASYATCLSFLTILFVCMYFAYRLYPMPWFKLSLIIHRKFKK